MYPSFFDAKGISYHGFNVSVDPFTLDGVFDFLGGAGDAGQVYSMLALAGQTPL